MATAVTSAAPRVRVKESASVAAESDFRVRLFDRVCAGVLIAFAILWLIPLLWAVDTAVKPNSETAKAPLTWWIDSPTLRAFTNVFRTTDMWSWYAASFVTSTVISAATVLVASMGAFALSRMHFRHQQLVFWLILAGIMIPPQVLIVPQFRLFDSLHLLNTYWAVILPQVPTAIAVFVFKQFFDGIPRELEEAARVDGAGFFRIYWTVIMPLARPAVSAVSIFTFVWAWNNLLWPLLVLTTPKLMTIPVGLATVQGSYGIRYADTMASALLGALPLVFVFLLFQRRIVEGIAGTGLKG